MALYEIASETGRCISMNARLTEDTNDQKCLFTDHCLQRLDTVTIWILQLFGGPHTSFFQR
jgi:hypothetical protein